MNKQSNPQASAQKSDRPDKDPRDPAADTHHARPGEKGGAGREAARSPSGTDDAADRAEHRSPAPGKPNKSVTASKPPPGSPETDDNGDVPAYRQAGRAAHGPDARPQAGQKD